MTNFAGDRGQLAGREAQPAAHQLPKREQQRSLLPPGLIETAKLLEQKIGVFCLQYIETAKLSEQQIRVYSSMTTPRSCPACGTTRSRCGTDRYPTWLICATFSDAAESRERVTLFISRRCSSTRESSQATLALFSACNMTRRWLI